MHEDMYGVGMSPSLTYQIAPNAATGGVMWYDGEAESVSITLLAGPTIEYHSTGLVRTSYNRCS